MRAYRIGAPGAFRFAGSQSDAAVHKHQLMAKYGIKRAQVTTEEIEVPTSKAELLEFLNKTIGSFDKKMGKV
jgi:hypothetical protein